MEKRFSAMNIHQKLELIIKEMLDKEVPYKDARREFEKIFIELASKKYNGNQTRIARALGIHRNTVHSRSKSLKIKRS